MKDRAGRNPAAEAVGEDTAELPALRLDQLPADEVQALGDTLASTDSWRVEPAQQQALEREAELGTLRLNLASMTQRHDELENSLRALTMNLRDLEEQLNARTAELAGKERALTAREVQVMELQQELAAAGQRHAELQGLCLAAEQRVAELLQSVQTLEASQAELQSQLEQALAEREQARTELRIAEERLRAADSELRSRDLRIERLTASEATHRQRSEELGRQLAERHALIHRLEHEAESNAAVLGKIQSNLVRLDKEESAVPRDLVARLLVRNDGNTEIVQVLGRRTLIGRGVDCQLQIDAEFVSRRHALVLVSPDETVIEDLNSTNGVYVNGQRVSRRRLAEGDQVMVGKTLFRYVVKPVADRGG